MPAPPLSNTLEGGTNGTTILAANSGGASGDAFSTVTTGVGSTHDFSNAQAAHGSLAMRIVMPAASPAATRVDWTGLGGGSANIYFRLYMYLSANPNVEHLYAGVRTTTATLSAQFGISTTGKLTAAPASGTDDVALTGATSIALNQWIRIEFRVLSSATVGEIEWRLYNSPDSTTITETLSKTGLINGATSDQIRFGVVTNPTTSQTSYYDDLAVSTVTWLGPSAVPAAVVATPPASNAFE